MPDAPSPRNPYPSLGPTPAESPAILHHRATLGEPGGVAPDPAAFDPWPAGLDSLLDDLSVLAADLLSACRLMRPGAMNHLLQCVYSLSHAARIERERILAELRRDEGDRRGDRRTIADALDEQAEMRADLAAVANASTIPHPAIDPPTLRISDAAGRVS